MTCVSDLSLTHYSEQPWNGPLFSVTQPPEPTDKPAGFWCSVDGSRDWSDWCKQNDQYLEALTHASRIILVPNARLLRMSNAKDLLAFSREYGASWAWQGLRCEEFCPLIRWSNVAQIYQGIIIAPYIYPCRHTLETFWYYGWDCACGCIWDAAAVAAVEPFKKRRGHPK